MQRHIKILLEYGASPIWDMSDIQNNGISDIYPFDLPISKNLAKKISEFNEIYQNLFVDNEKTFEFSGFSDYEEAKIFIKNGDELIQELKKELGDRWIVEYEGFGRPEDFLNKS